MANLCFMNKPIFKATALGFFWHDSDVFRLRSTFSTLSISRSPCHCESPLSKLIVIQINASVNVVRNKRKEIHANVSRCPKFHDENLVVILEIISVSVCVSTLF